MTTHIASLFANTSTDTWLTNETLVTVGSVVGGVVTIIGFIQWVTGRYRRRTKKLLIENENLKEQLVAKDAAHLQAVKDIHATCEIAKADAESSNAELTSQRRKIQRALSKDGQTWNERVLRSAPDFKALDPEGRPTPIISVLNLKGGVGKTTITANLGAALDNRGYRVLLVDLDLQGSLTGLYLPDDRQEQLSNESKLIADFLEAAFEKDSPNMLDYTHEILGEQKSGLVPTTDGLAYAETNLTIRWLLREEGNRDPRFLLRKELHLKRITNNYDIVLIDCPPVINICCVNALAASDYLLVPILPSKQATSRVPVLLKRLKEFRENINAELKVLGVLANRTQRSDLTYEEESRLTALRSVCKDVWGSEIPLFETFIRQAKEIRSAEDSHRPLAPDEEAFQSFDELAQEVIGSLPTYVHARVADRATKEVAS